MEDRLNDFVIGVCLSMVLLSKNGVRYINGGIRNVKMGILNSCLCLVTGGVFTW